MPSNKRHKRARSIDAKFFSREKHKGRLAVYQDIIAQYLPSQPLPTTLTQCKKLLEQKIHIDIWQHDCDTATLLSKQELRTIKRKHPFPLKEAKQSEVLRALLR